MATNAEMMISHIATGLYVKISNYDYTEFSDTIDTQYNTVQTFGRMDPIVNYQGATRKISLGIKMDSTTGADDRDGIHKKIGRLMKMQYPVYQRSANALTIQRPPIVAVSLGNLIRDGNGGPLICAMNGFAFTPNAGFTPEDSPFVRFGEPRANSPTTVSNAADSQIGFKTYNFKFNFTVLHQSPPGFQLDSPITDPDAIGPNGSSYAGQPKMRFLGGYKFGPRDADRQLTTAGITKGNAIVYSSNDDDPENIQTQADSQAIFNALGFGG